MDRVRLTAVGQMGAHRVIAQASFIRKRVICRDKWGSVKWHVKVDAKGEKFQGERKWVSSSWVLLCLGELSTWGSGWPSAFVGPSVFTPLVITEPWWSWGTMTLSVWSMLLDGTDPTSRRWVGTWHWSGLWKLLLSSRMGTNLTLANENHFGDFSKITGIEHSSYGRIPKLLTRAIRDIDAIMLGQPAKNGINWKKILTMMYAPTVSWDLLSPEIQPCLELDLCWSSGMWGDESAFWLHLVLALHTWT